MRSVLTKLTALAGAVALVASCDTRLPTATNVVGSSPASSPSSPNTANTSIVIDSPLVGTLINLGDSVLVSVRLHDANALRSASMTGVTAKGSVDLGTFTTTPRYKAIGIPAAGVFRAGLRDTTIRRYLQPINPADTALDSLIIVVTATNVAGVADTATRVINIVAGPSVKIVSPTNGDSVPAGVGLSVGARSQSPNGVGRIDISVRGESN